MAEWQKQRKLINHCTWHNNGEYYIIESPIMIDFISIKVLAVALEAKHCSFQGVFFAHQIVAKSIECMANEEIEDGNRNYLD